MELHLLLPFIGTLLFHCTMFWFFSHLTVPASIRYRLVNRHRQCRTFRIRSYFDHYECPSFHFHRLHSIVVPIVELSKKVQEFRFFFSILTNQALSWEWERQKKKKFMIEFNSLCWSKWLFCRLRSSLPDWWFWFFRFMNVIYSAAFLRICARLAFFFKFF